MQRLTDVTTRISGWLGGPGHARRVIVPSAAADRPVAAVAPPPPHDGDRGGAPATLGASEGRTRLVDAFNAAHPVARRRELRGRDDQLNALFDGVLGQRKHAIVHGARGSGKTSLVRVFADHADRRGVVLIYLACDAHSTFVGLMRPFIRFVPAGNIPAGRERAFRAEVAALGTKFGPRELVSLLVQLAPKPIIFILDEFDRVTDPGVQDAIATTMKLLSDAKAPAQLLVVGIAQSVTELIDHHPSLRRHMTAVSVGRIADAEIDRLIEEGAARARITVEPAARAMLVAAAAGSPYHARLFAYHAGMAALDDDDDQVTADRAHTGLARAIDEWARVNDPDHALFEHLAGYDEAGRAALGEIATFAARNQGGVPEAAPGTAADQALRLLAPALDRNGNRTMFRDSLAPQFLIAMMRTSEAREGAPEPARLVGMGVTSRWT